MPEPTIRPATQSDAPALIAANQANRAHHAPWVEPFTTQEGFTAWFAGIESGRRVAFLVFDGPILAGVINLNEIVHGIFRSAYLGYYGYAEGAGRGVMTRALGLVIAEAFGPMGLHRLEANIQPENHRSKALAQRLGFGLEGYSPGYLFIDGAWRDHERWALRSDQGEGR
jgi:ribosomal-protein-alanine N-acetyltransferase